MIDYVSLVDRILEAHDYRSVLMELKNYNVKTFEEFVKIIEDFDKRIKKKGIETKLDVDSTAKALTWFLDYGYMGNKDATFVVNSFDNGKLDCDTTKKCNIPGTSNLNKHVDANQVLKILDGFVYTLEKEDIENSSRPEETEEKTKEELEDEEFEFDPSVKSILDKLKTDGDALIDKYKNIPPFKYNGKEYKITDGELMASTEKELVASLEFPRELEIDIYDTGKEGNALRTALQKYFYRNQIDGKSPVFRMDMDKNPYFYVPVGKLPVKKTTGPEARAILNYYDGKNVRFQPKQKD